jgi:FkbM family methyltransferase
VTEAAERDQHYRLRLGGSFLAHLFKAVFKQHHREDIPVLRRLIPSDGVVVDVGAHAGQYTKLFARLAGQGFVYAVEPGSYARLILRLAIFGNRLRNVAILPMALGERPGVMMLRMPVKRSGAYGFGLSHLGATDRSERMVAELVPVGTLDELAAIAGLTRLDFIKADIEGWEMQMIRGGSASLRRFRPALLLEMTERGFARAGDTLAGAWRMLEELGYRAHVAREGALHAIERPREGDIFWIARPINES